MHEVSRVHQQMLMYAHDDVNLWVQLEKCILYNRLKRVNESPKQTSLFKHVQTSMYSMAMYVHQNNWFEVERVFIYSTHIWWALFWWATPHLQYLPLYTLRVYLYVAPEKNSVIAVLLVSVFLSAQLDKHWIIVAKVFRD